MRIRQMVAYAPTWPALEQRLAGLFPAEEPMDNENAPARLYDVTIRYRKITESTLRHIAAQQAWPPIVLDTVGAGAVARITAEDDQGSTIFELRARTHKEPKP